jgi:hypothetical protein
LDLGESVEASLELSLLGDFSVLASDFFVLLFVEESASVVAPALVFFSLFVELSAGLLLVAGLFVVVDDLVVGEAVMAGAAVGEGLVAVALADGVIVEAADAEGVIVAPTLAAAAGVALAFVWPATPVVVVAPVVVAPVVPVVEVTPTLKLGVTP